jgi:hypothetical protein
MFEYKFEYVKVGTELQLRMNAFAIEGYKLHTAMPALGQQPPTLIVIWEKEHKTPPKPKKKKIVTGLE